MQFHCSGFALLVQFWCRFGWLLGSGPSVQLNALADWAALMDQVVWTCTVSIINLYTIVTSWLIIASRDEDYHFSDVLCKLTGRWPVSDVNKGPIRSKKTRIWTPAGPVRRRWWHVLSTFWMTTPWTLKLRYVWKSCFVNNLGEISVLLDQNYVSISCV